MDEIVCRFRKIMKHKKVRLSRIQNLNKLLMHIDDSNKFKNKLLQIVQSLTVGGVQEVVLLKMENFIDAYNAMKEKEKLLVRIIALENENVRLLDQLVSIDEQTKQYTYL